MRALSLKISVYYFWIYNNCYQAFNSYNNKNNYFSYLVSWSSMILYLRSICRYPACTDKLDKNIFYVQKLVFKSNLNKGTLNGFKMTPKLCPIPNFSCKPLSNPGWIRNLFFSESYFFLNCSFSITMFLFCSELTLVKLKTTIPSVFLIR